MNYEPKGGAYDAAYIAQGLIPIDQAASDLSGEDMLGEI
jgi:hypothetical protein